MTAKRALSALKRRFLGRDLAALFSVSTSTIYHWSKRLPKAREDEIRAVWEAVKTLSRRPPRTLKEKRDTSAKLVEKLTAESTTATATIHEFPLWSLVEGGLEIRGRDEKKYVYDWTGSPELVSDRGLPSEYRAIYLYADRPDGAEKYSKLSLEFSSALHSLIEEDDAYPFRLGDATYVKAVVYI